ncbi:MAG: sulfur carrier protein ThiS [Candidatus Dormibacteria bacterium]
MSPASTVGLTVNGDGREVAEGASLGDLLRTLEVRPAAVVVELNGVIYRRNEGLDAVLRAGDVVEIVHFVGGG